MWKHWRTMWNTLLCNQSHTNKSAGSEKKIKQNPQSPHYWPDVIPTGNNQQKKMHTILWAHVILLFPWHFSYPKFLWIWAGCQPKAIQTSKDLATKWMIHRRQVISYSNHCLKQFTIYTHKINCTTVPVSRARWLRVSFPPKTSGMQINTIVYMYMYLWVYYNTVAKHVTDPF